MDRKFYLDLARGGLRMPIGTDLVLKEKVGEGAFDGKQLGEAVVTAAERFETPLAFPLMDLTLEKEWMLAGLGVPADEIPTWHFQSCPTAEETDKITVALGAGPSPRLRRGCEALAYVRDRRGLTPVGMAIGPFSLMTKLIADPITEVYLAALGETNAVETALELATEAILQGVRAQVDAGAKAICVCEPAANQVYISPLLLEQGNDAFDRFVIKYNKRIKALLTELGADLIFHDCGELVDTMVSKFTELDPAIMSLGCSRKLWEDARLVPKSTVLFGNLPSKKFYSDEAMPLECVGELAIELLENMNKTGHPFILGSECDVLYVPEAAKTIQAKIDMMLSVGAKKPGRPFGRR